MITGEHFDRKIWVANGKLPHYYVIKMVCDGHRQVSSGKYWVGSFFYHNYMGAKQMGGACPDQTTGSAKQLWVKEPKDLVDEAAKGHWEWDFKGAVTEKNGTYKIPLTRKQTR